MSGFMSMVKGAAVSAKVAAQKAADATVAAYNDAWTPPTEVTCTDVQCAKEFPVPPESFNWSCSKGHVNNGKDKTCWPVDKEECGEKAPEKPTQPVLKCPFCDTQVKVPMTKAANVALSSATFLRKGAKDTVDYTKETYRDLQSRPTKFKCSCGEEVEVPASAWQWTCEAGHSNVPDVFACTEKDCDLKPPNVPVTAKCSKCEKVTDVPASNARIYAATAITTTKEAAKSARDTTIQTYQHLKRPPTVFNCSLCAAKLAVPDPGPTWNCREPKSGAKKGVLCDQENPSAELKCAKCSGSRVMYVLCGSCGGETQVPATNMKNDLRQAGYAIKRRMSGAGVASDPK